jgi:hypothetical protein
MAKPKVEVIVNVVQQKNIEIYCSNAESAVKELRDIEGVTWVASLSNTIIIVHTDPRYDVNEIRDEIYELLTAKVPDVFKD